MATREGQVSDRARSSSNRDASSYAPLVKGYLVAYNVVQSCGWGLILINTIQYLSVNFGGIGLEQGVPGLYKKVRKEVLIFQTLAILEIIHCITGIVRSGVLTTMMQVYSRLFILWGVIEAVHGIPQTFGILFALLAWSLVEVIRYAYYASSLIGSVPYFLLWLRYTVFYVLYPIGVLGELMMAFTAMPIVKASQQFSLTLPNCYNMAFSYYYYIIFTALMYIPAFPQLYGHMMKQRAKIIGGEGKEKKD